MQNEGLVYLKADCVEVYSSSRLELAVKAATLGADMQHVGRLLCWQEFEEMAAYSLKTMVTQSLTMCTLNREVADGKWMLSDVKNRLSCASTANIGNIQLPLQLFKK